MSQIKINKIAGKTADQNLTVAPDGNGVLEVSGDNDAAIHLKDSQNLNGVKIQAPPSSAAQDYTLILPDTDLVQDRYLAVDSITTGSGSTAVGQLRSATISPPDLTNLNASNLTSGTVPNARYTVTASSGAGWKLINKTTVSSASIYVYFTGLEANAHYMMVGQDIKMTGNGWCRFAFLESNGTSTVNDQEYERFEGRYNSGSSQGPGAQIEMQMTHNVDRQNFILEFCAGDPNSSDKSSQVGWYQARAFDRDGSMYRCKIFGSVEDNYQLNTNTRFYGIRFSAYYNIDAGAEFALYKFQET